MSAANRGALLSGGWTRGGTSEVVRRAHPASGAQWNVQVVRGKVNGKCLWNACKALSLGLLLMLLGAAMATIGYYADQLSVAQEIRGNHTVAVKNESRGFHLNNLSYAGPIVMGVGGFIVVAACVMTFEARDSAAKVVPARLKLSTTGPPSGTCAHNAAVRNGHGSLRTAGSQTAVARGSGLKNPFQSSINRSPSAPDLVLQPASSSKEASPTSSSHPVAHKSPIAGRQSRRTFAACALLNPGLLHRQALSVDETGGNYRSNESLQHGTGSQGSMAMDLHLEAVTLKIRDKRRNPLKRQRKIEEDEHKHDGSGSRRNSHSCSPRLSGQHLRESAAGGSAQYLASHGQHSCPRSNRRSSNSSDCSYRTRSRRRESNSCHHARGHLERTISSGECPEANYLD
ncbi:hypothetical protein D910_04765 [Dendroctonus ponderosae]|uniref:Transmembrane protein 200A n=1 Tax=Dendroctonus ponderosae TaxID=77166 RepID=U4UBQ6_DENPD|nr:hypothetical protein D910_04765 [Dendroctonus ponderosae]